jgi:hypothetical protein
VTQESSEADDLEHPIRVANRIVVGLFLAVIGVYVVWFWLMHSQIASTSTETWGSFGGFVGGVLSPVVAYAAFYWLTRSVRLQRQELVLTRKALEESSRSQQSHAKHAFVGIRVSALTALIEAITGEVHMQRLQLQFILDQSARHHAGSAKTLDGTFKSGEELQAHIRVLNDGVQGKMTVRYEYVQELEQLLATHQDAP